MFHSNNTVSEKVPKPEENGSQPLGVKQFTALCSSSTETLPRRRYQILLWTRKKEQAMGEDGEAVPSETGGGVIQEELGKEESSAREKGRF